jgi:hypothetical protein
MRRQLFCAVLFCLARLAFSQTFGAITGEVKDPSGAVTAGASVVLFTYVHVELLSNNSKTKCSPIC